MRLALILALYSLASGQAIRGHGAMSGNGNVSNVSTGFSATFYASPSGSDSNNCTSFATPCASFDHIRSKIRTALSGCVTPIVAAFSGTASTPYYGTTSALIASDTGTSSCPVSYVNYPLQTPVFSGGTLLQGSWTRNVTTGTCAAAHTAGFTCDQMTLVNTTPNFEVLFYYNAGTVNYGQRRFRPRLGANTYAITSVSAGSGGLTVYHGTFTGCYSPTQVYGGPAGISSTSSIFIMGATNVSNNGLFQVNSCTGSTMTVNGATGVAETFSGTAVNDIGTFQHVGNPSGTISQLVLSANVLYVSVSNNFIAGYNATFSGITDGSWTFLNNQSCTISATSLSSSLFQCPYTNTNVGLTAISAGVAIENSGPNNASFAYKPSDNNLPTGLTSCNIGGGGPFDCELLAWDKWTMDIQRILSTDDTNHIITTTCGPSNCRGSGGAGVPYQLGYRYMVENAKELLVQPGQWYLDRSTNPWTLSYVELGGENPNVDQVVVPNNAQVLTATSVDYLTFSGLAFEHDNWTVPATGYLSTQLDYNLPLTASMVQCAACGSHVTFSGDTFQHTVTVGLAVTGASSPTITGSIFNDIGAYGARIGGAPNQSGTSPSDTQVPNNVTLSQNWFEETGRWFSSADGYMIGLANNVTSTNNDVGYSYHAGVEVCEPGQPGPNQCSATPWTASNHGDFNIIFTQNDFHDVGQAITVDTAFLYAMTSYCPNSSVSTCQSSNAITSATGNVFSNNRLHDANSAVVNGDTADIGVHGIYLDGNTGLWTVKNNLVYRVTGMLVNQNFGPQLASQNNLFQNNILLNSASNGGIGGCLRLQSPLNTVLEFVFQSNICGMDVSANTTVNMQTGPPASGSSSIQQFVKNLYNFTGTPKFNIVGHSNQSFATWQSTYGEDTAGTISTSPGFNFPGNCANNSTVPVPGTCDDFTFANGTGPGFGFIVGGAGMTYTFGPTVPITIPPVTDTYPIATLPLNQF